MDEPIKRRGLMFVLSSPSGAGKTTLSRRILASDPNISLSISVTTRAPRPGEVDGVDYFFRSTEEFGLMVNRGEFLEHAKVFDHYYGTPKAPVDAALASGRDILFDVDWQGTQQIQQQAADDLVRVFILPPSMRALEDRLRWRAQDGPEVIARRMSKASGEISHWAEYEYVIINNDIDKAESDVRAVLHAERLKRKRQSGLVDFVRGLTSGL